MPSQPLSSPQGLSKTSRAQDLRCSVAFADQICRPMIRHGLLVRYVVQWSLKTSIWTPNQFRLLKISPWFSAHMTVSWCWTSITKSRPCLCSFPATYAVHDLSRNLECLRSSSDLFEIVKLVAVLHSSLLRTYWRLIPFSSTLNLLTTDEYLVLVIALRKVQTPTFWRRFHGVWVSFKLIKHYRMNHVSVPTINTPSFRLVIYLSDLLRQ